jgi:hypothetical protein
LLTTRRLKDLLRESEELTAILVASRKTARRRNDVR